MICAVIKAVDEYQDLLRFSVAGPGNDYRLGGYEAPPAIISMCLGEDLERILARFAAGKGYGKHKQETLRIGADALPGIPKDTTDRNRTSPFAFTGNKFEFRSLGSSMSASDCNTILNTTVAESFRVFADILEKAPDFNAALQELIAQTMRRHGRIIFSGNGYAQDWVEEAANRGLSNYPSSAEAIPHALDKKNVEVLERHGVLSRTEIAAVVEILLENYCKQINIEAAVMSEMIRRDILPAVIEYAGKIASTISLKESIGGYHKFPHRAETELLDRVSALCDRLYESCGELDSAREKTASIEDMSRRALSYRECVLPAMGKVRESSDALECIVSKSAWPYPSYGSLLYRV